MPDVDQGVGHASHGGRGDNSTGGSSSGNSGNGNSAGNATPGNMDGSMGGRGNNSASNAAASSSGNYGGSSASSNAGMATPGNMDGSMGERGNNSASNAAASSSGDYGGGEGLSGEQNADVDNAGLPGNADGSAGTGAGKSEAEISDHHSISVFNPGFLGPTVDTARAVAQDVNTINDVTDNLNDYDRLSIHELGTIHSKTNTQQEITQKVDQLATLATSIMSQSAVMTNNHPALGQVAWGAANGIVSINDDDLPNFYGPTERHVSLDERLDDYDQVAGLMNVAADIKGKTVDQMEKAFLDGFGVIGAEIHSQNPTNANEGLLGGNTLGNMLAQAAAYASAAQKGLDVSNQISFTEFSNTLNLNQPAKAIAQEMLTSMTGVSSLNSHGITFKDSSSVSQIAAVIDVMNDYANVVAIDAQDEKSLSEIADELGISDINNMTQEESEALAQASLDSRINDDAEIATLNQIAADHKAATGQDPQISGSYGKNHKGVLSAAEQLNNKGTETFENVEPDDLSIGPNGHVTGPTGLVESYDGLGTLGGDTSDIDGSQEADTLGISSVSSSSSHTAEGISATISQGISGLQSTAATIDVLGKELGARAQGESLEGHEVAADLGISQEGYSDFIEAGGMDFVNASNETLVDTIQYLTSVNQYNDLKLMFDVAGELEGTVDNPIEAAVEIITTDVVKGYYTNILGREADADGLEHHVKSVLEGNQTIADVRETIRYSEEGIEKATQDIYMNTLGRNADEEGADYWFQKISSGEMTIDEVRNSIQFSEEGVSKFINNTYSTILERDADEEGKEFYTEKVNAGEMKLFDVLNNISNSREAIEVKIEKIYGDILERESDEEGKEYYVEKVIAREMSVDDVRKNISDSNEATNVRVENIYNNILKRDADDEGKEYYVEKIQTGEMSLLDVVENIASSSESIELQIEAIYKDVLGRSADRAGKDFYLDKIETGEMSLVDIAQTVINSEEAVGNRIKDIYEEVLGREADADGLEYYVNQVVSGELSLDGVRENITSSEESQELLAQAAADAAAAADLAARTQAESDIRPIYEEVLGREADADGLEYYVNQVVSGELSLDGVRENITASDESQELLAQAAADAAAAADLAARTQAESDIRPIYEEVLGREADADGLEYYVNQVVSGELSLDGVRENITSSEESQELLAQAAADAAAAADLAARTQAESDIRPIYEEVLGREADADGLEYYVNQVVSGELSLDGVRENITASDEMDGYTNTYAAASEDTVRHHVNQLYIQNFGPEFDPAYIEAQTQKVLNHEIRLDDIRGEIQTTQLVGQLYIQNFGPEFDPAYIEAQTQKVLNHEITLDDIRGEINETLEAKAQAAAADLAARTQAESDIRPIYEEVLGREADADGLEYYVNQVVSGELSLDGVRENITSSEESQELLAQAAADAAAAADLAARTQAESDIRPIYEEVLGREADADGLEYYVNQVVSGELSLDGVRENITSSEESQELLAQAAADAAAAADLAARTQAESDIRPIYEEVLGREADADGLEYYVNQVVSGELSLDGVRENITASDEMDGYTNTYAAASEDTVRHHVNQLYIQNFGPEFDPAYIEAQTQKVLNHEIRLDDIRGEIQTTQLVGQLYIQNFGPEFDPAYIEAQTQKVLNHEITLDDIRGEINETLEAKAQAAAADLAARTQAESDIRPIYEEVLGREADADGLEYYVNQVVSGELSLDGVRENITSSEESQELLAQAAADAAAAADLAARTQAESDIRPIYEEVLGREADADGLEYYVNQVVSGELSLDGVRENITASDEMDGYTNTYAAASEDTVRHHVNQLYIQNFGPEFDPAYIEAQTQKVLNHEIRLDDIRGEIQTTQLVGQLYIQNFGPEFDPAYIEAQTQKVLNHEITLDDIRGEIQTTQFVKQLYTEGFGPEFDPAYIEAQTQKVLNHEIRLDDIRGEIQTTQLVGQLYIQNFGPEFDPAYIEAQTQKVLNHEITLDDIRGEINETLEAKAQAAAADLAARTQAESDIRPIYEEVLGREADADGLEYYVNQVVSGELSLDGVRENITSSEESQELLAQAAADAAAAADLAARTQAESDIRPIYEEVLGREADADGLEYYVNQVVSGELSLDGVRENITASDEMDGYTNTYAAASEDTVRHHVNQLYIQNFGPEFDPAYIEAQTQKVLNHEIRLDDIRGEIQTTQLVGQLYIQNFGPEFDPAYIEAQTQKVLNHEITLDDIRGEINETLEAKAQAAAADLAARTQAESDIRPIYEEVLGREADADGLEYYVNQVVSGELSLDGVRENITSSEESQELLAQAAADAAAAADLAARTQAESDIRPIYEEVLGREADADGLEYYVNQVVSGELSLDGVRENITSSEESQELLAQAAADAAAAADLAARTQAESDIRPIYEEVLGREADADGLEYYVNQVVSGELSLDGVRENITSSEESQELLAQAAADAAAAADLAARTQAESDIRPIYEEVLGREADADGLEYYVNQVVSGELSLDGVRENITSSEESRANAAAQQAAADEAAAIKAAEIAAQKAAAAQAAQEAAREAAAIKAAQDAKIAQELEDQVEKDIDNIYETILDRSSDAAGLDYYTQKVISGEMSIADIKENISNSPEARANAAAKQAAADEAAAIQAAEIAAQKAAAAQTAQEAAREAAAIKVAAEKAAANDPLESLYNNVLGRESDAEGKEFWQSQIDNGMSIAEVQSHMENSTEYKEKTPLVLDLDGDGIELTQVWNGVVFDIDNDGIKEQTAWAAADDALLAYDENGDGTINDQSELFGDTDTLTDGFNKLASYDDNQDGVIDSGDEIFEDLVAWQDVNQDGVSDSDEMLSLESLNIVSINLNAEMPENMYIEGNWISHVSDYTKADGSSYEVSDVWFQYEDDYTQEDSSGFMFTQGQVEDDVIIDFNSEKGSVLDISNYLSDYNEVQNAIDNFVFTTTKNSEDILLNNSVSKQAEDNTSQREIFSHAGELQDSIMNDDSTGIL